MCVCVCVCVYEYLSAFIATLSLSLSLSLSHTHKHTHTRTHTHFIFRHNTVDRKCCGKFSAVDANQFALVKFILKRYLTIISANEQYMLLLILHMV